MYCFGNSGLVSWLLRIHLKNENETKIVVVNPSAKYGTYGDSVGNLPEAFINIYFFLIFIFIFDFLISDITLTIHFCQPSVSFTVAHKFLSGILFLTLLTKEQMVFFCQNCNWSATPRVLFITLISEDIVSFWLIHAPSFSCS